MPAHCHKPSVRHARTFTYIEMIWREEWTCKSTGPRSWIPTLAAGALAAVYDRQDDRLALPALTLQAEEADWVVRVQTVTAALTDWLEVGLLSGDEMMGGGGYKVDGVKWARRLE